MIFDERSEANIFFAIRFIGSRLLSEIASANVRRVFVLKKVRLFFCCMIHFRLDVDRFSSDLRLRDSLDDDFYCVCVENLCCESETRPQEFVVRFVKASNGF